MNEELKARFHDYLILEKGLMPGSAKSYIRHINYLYEAASMEILEFKNYASIAALIRKVKQSRKGKNKDTWTDNMAAKTADMATVFYTWAARERIIDQNPMQFGHEFSKGTSPPPRYIENYKETLTALESHPFHTKRDGCIYRLLWASGARISEICNMDIEHVDLETGFIKIAESKTGQFRTAYTNEEAITSLREYIHGLNKIGYTGKALFFSERRERFKTNTLIKFIIKRGREVGLKISAHMFRHGVGRNMRKNGAPLEDIADVLGHKSLSSTRIYATLGSEEIKKKYMEYHKTA